MSILTYCRDFVRIPGETGQEQQAALFLKAAMKALGFDEVAIDEYGSVIGVIHGHGEQTIMLEGHLDTVGITDASAWTVEPYGGLVRDGKLYGRGASDMRAALMSMTCAAADLISEKERLQGNIVVTGVVCEETFEGIAFGKILDRLQPHLVILGEATELKVCIGQRGRAEIQIITQGKSAHSANPSQGVNAAKQMMRLCQQLEQLKLPVDELLGPAILELTDIHSEPYPGKSIVPERCLATFDRRTLPGESEASVLQPIQEIIAQLHNEDSTFQAEVQVVAAEEQCYTGQMLSGTRFFPAWKASADAPYVRTALQALESAGFPAQCSHYSFCTDGSQSAGVRAIPTIGFGPSRESLAHVVDEYIELEQLERTYHGYIALLRGMLLG